MDSCFEERLCEEIRRHPHLYDSSLREYKDGQMVLNSWREIAQSLGRDENHCRYKWKYLRDKYVRTKRKQKGRRTDIGLPSIISKLDWLSSFIKHREAPTGAESESGHAHARSARPTRTSSDAACASARPVQVRRCPRSESLLSEPHLPVSSLHLLVPPLRLMSACMWQVAQERNVDQYDKLAEFITLVTEMVPELLNYKQKTQLILGLKARLILESLKRTDNVDDKTIQYHLNSFQKMTTNIMHEEDEDEEVEISKSAFVELVQTLLTDQSEKEHFFKEIYLVLYGARFDTVLQILVWEFFCRLEEFLPVPSFSQVFSMFDVSSLDCEFEQFVSDPEDLKRILQHQQERQKLNKKTADEATLQPTKSPVESLREHLELSRKKEPSEKSTMQSSTGDRADVSLVSDDNTCSECGKTFANRSTLKQHRAVHSSARPFKCSQCSKTYKNQRDLNRHLLSHFNPKILSCSLCDKKYSSQASLTVHLRHHSGERPFACSYCDKRFFRNEVLKSHMRIHTGERPYACNYCDKTFTQPGVRAVHQRVHKKEKPYLCSTCGMSFCSSGELLVHSRTHTGERPYQCDSCGKRFGRAGQLTLHRRSHTGERPYPCSECEKSFHCSSGLRKHMRTHTGEKPYQCVTCHKTFSEKSNMRIHLKVHKNF
ncbi:zinc finger protein 557-like isoform X2 [Plectropomus leopardus]|uniref:zinc finger protein 557-like isoform X2 n=1 Tax=Plectropomus leopardus TaxID=160734 RepID=UPI001C4BD6A9|nr:zinc finger protein 557-like isoform X2 [Plectropomus leopardus]